MSKFTRTKEDFICEHCGTKVTGTGYTNHCPQCLWSKHVDINPGDRAHNCGGLMEPVSLEMDHGEYAIVHCCQKCGLKKHNKTSSSDDFNAIIRLTKRVAKNLKI